MVHHGSDIEERLGGVAAIEALVGAPSAEPETKGIKFANVLSNALRQCCVSDGRAAGSLSTADAQRQSGSRKIGRVLFFHAPFEKARDLLSRASTPRSSERCH